MWLTYVKPSTAYHPQTDGLTKRTNQTLEIYLWTFCSYQQDDWVDYLALAKFSLNNSINSSTQQTPFFTNLGYHPNFNINITDQTTNPSATNLTTRLMLSGWWWAKLLCRPAFSHFRTFRVTRHTHGHIIKFTVLLLSSRSHFIIWLRSFYCSQLLIFILLFFCFFVFCHTVARVTADVTAEAIVTFAELREISCFSFFFVLLSLVFLWVLFYFLMKPRAWQPRPKLALAILGQHSLRATSGSAQKKLRSPHAMRNHVLRLFVFYSI